MYNCISGDKWMYVMPRSVSDCIIYITDVRIVSGWATVSEPEVILVAKGHAYNYILPG